MFAAVVRIHICLWAHKKIRSVASVALTHDFRVWTSSLLDTKESLSVLVSHNTFDFFGQFG